ncbi:DoxX family protein [Aegicerativicinus sediminis]
MIKNGLSLGLLILRISISVGMLTHGIPKTKYLFNDPSQFSDPLGFGGTLSLILVLIAEIVGPIFVIIGYKTRLATIPPIITMLVAFILVHSDDDFGRREKAFLYAIGFITILLTGAGKYALDKWKK